MVLSYFVNVKGAQCWLQLCETHKLTVIVIVLEDT